jgi:3-oxoacyl-[acyl-carrier protein] reductase
MNKHTDKEESEPTSSSLLLQDKTALVTGGGRGVGAATSKLLAARDANVIVNYFNNKEAANKVVEEIKNANKEDRGLGGGGAIAMQADVREPIQVEHIVEESIQHYGHINILVNNAMVGRYFLKSFLETTWDDFSEKFNVEIKAAYEVTRAVLPNMVRQNYGRIIYVATGSAKYPSPPGAIAFRTAKAGLVTFAKYIAQEFGTKVITANIVSPGLIETDQNAHFPAEIKQQYASLTTIGRTGKPEDVARVIAFFASDESEYMTGTYAPVDGGLVIGG